MKNNDTNIYLNIEHYENFKMLDQHARLCNVYVLPAVWNRDNAGTILGDLEENWHGQVEVSAWWIAPATIVARLS